MTTYWSILPVTTKTQSAISLTMAHLRFNKNPPSILNETVSQTFKNISATTQFITEMTIQITKAKESNKILKQTHEITFGAFSESDKQHLANKPQFITNAIFPNEKLIVDTTNGVNARLLREWLSQIVPFSEEMNQTIAKLGQLDEPVTEITRPKSP